MAEIGVNELKNAASQVIESVEAGERYIIMKRGRPAAVIISMEEAEDFVLGHAEDYVRMRATGRRAHAAVKSAPLDEV